MEGWRYRMRLCHCPTLARTIADHVGLEADFPRKKTYSRSKLSNNVPDVICTTSLVAGMATIYPV